MSCLLALFLFVQGHAVNPNLQYGWLLGDGQTWGYTFFFNKEEVHYFAFGHIPDDSKVKMRLAGVCTQDGKEYPILKADYSKGIATRPR